MPLSYKITSVKLTAITQMDKPDENLTEEERDALFEVDKKTLLQGFGFEIPEDLPSSKLLEAVKALATIQADDNSPQAWDRAVKETIGATIKEALTNTAYSPGDKPDDSVIKVGRKWISQPGAVAYPVVYSGGDISPVEGRLRMGVYVEVETEIDGE